MANEISLRFFNSLFLFLFIPALLLAQSKNDRTVVGTVGDQKITYSELKQNYSSGADSDMSLEDLESFLPIYLNYKAKLMAAKEQGYYQDSVLIEEHKSYALQAAYAYWLEKEIKPSALEEFKYRSGYELKTYHILIAVGSNTNQHEINEAIAKLNEAKAEIENGTPLDEVNQKYSTVRSGRSMGGDIPWLSAGRTVKEFEDAIYELEVGEISEPFRTQFGYHIVLLQDKRERTPARLTNHIFVRGTGDSTSYDKIYEAYDELEDGKNWNEVLKRFSEDGASVRNGGNIGWVSYKGNFAMEFVDAVMKIEPDLPYSEPVKTNYGYHIFKIDSVEVFESEEKRNETLLKELKETPYYAENNKFITNYLEEKFNGKENKATLDEYKNWVTEFDTTEISELPDPTALSKKIVYEFNEEEFSISDYHNYLKNEFGERAAKNYLAVWFNNFTKNILESNLIDLTIEHYPKFKKQSQSYLDGLVIYNLNEDNIWSSATVDSTRLLSIYENNEEEYQYPERPFYYMLTARHDSTLNKAITFINEGGSPDSLRKNIERLGVISDSTISLTQEPFDMLRDMEIHTFSEKFDYNNLKAVFWLEDRLPARKMNFEEAFNRLMSVFQPQREQEWIEELNNKYNIKADFKKLRKAYQKDS
ncbi:MAG: peptidylprolyl isomerase [Balneolaceae bacterium]